VYQSKLYRGVCFPNNFALISFIFVVFYLKLCTTTYVPKGANKTSDIHQKCKKKRDPRGGDHAMLILPVMKREQIRNSREKLSEAINRTDRSQVWD
jgi:hypothetical protein